MPNAKDARAWAADGGLHGIGDSLYRVRRSGRHGRTLGACAGWYTNYPGRPDYFTHWGAAFRHAASVIGLPMGDYPESRPPQAVLPDAARQQITAAYERAGLARHLTSA